MSCVPGAFDPNRPAEKGAFPPPTRGLIFRDGQMLIQAKNLAQFVTEPDVYFVAWGGRSIYARFADADDDPAGHHYEITTREQVFAPKYMGLGFIRVEGFTMEHGATFTSWRQYGMVSTTGGRGPWIIEKNVIRWSNACGLDLGHAGRKEIRPLLQQEMGDPPDLSFEPGSTDAPPWLRWVRHNVICDNGDLGLGSMGGWNLLVEYNRFERNGWHGVINY